MRRVWSGEIGAGFASRCNAYCRYAVCLCKGEAGGGGGWCSVYPRLYDIAMYERSVVLAGGNATHDNQGVIFLVSTRVYF